MPLPAARTLPTAPAPTAATPLPACWQAVVGDEFNQPYMQRLRDFLQAEKTAGKVIYPHSSRWFHALHATPFAQVNVVILGQDPYHGPGQAHGLSFSVPHGVRPPPSLWNIYKELARDVGIAIPPHGCLEAWAQQGVLLLNSVLTVEHTCAASHQGKGWEPFTDALIRAVATRREHIVFLLWGSYAQRKGSCIDNSRHLVLHAPHPSPLSAHRGFLGCGHFSQTNAYLTRHGKNPINWQL